MDFVYKPLKERSLYAEEQATFAEMQAQEQNRKRRQRRRRIVMWVLRRL